MATRRECRVSFKINLFLGVDMTYRRAGFSTVLVIAGSLQGCAAPPKHIAVYPYQLRERTSVPIESLAWYRAPKPFKEPTGAVFYGPAYVPEGIPLPPYPDPLADSGMAGEAKARCVIQVDGRATDCQVMLSTNSPLFGASLLQWLNEPSLRFHPITLNGTAIVQSHDFDVHFGATLIK
jgi:hypothetical protein